MNIGLIGKGALGTFLLEKINVDQLIPGCRITAIIDEREHAHNDLARIAHDYECVPFDSMDAFLDSTIDLVVECANIDVVRKYGEAILKRKSLLLISIGAFSDVVLKERMEKIALEKSHQIYLPSGAIGGLDIIKAANFTGALDHVTLTTRKPAHSLTSVQLEEEQVIFQGSAKEAIHKFPKNANVAIALSLAGLGIEKTNVTIIADPYSKKNVHHIHASGSFGDYEGTIMNNPSPENPKTSYVTGLSILATLKNVHEPIKIG